MKETLVQVFSCKFCEILKNTFFTEQLQTTNSESRHTLTTIPSQMLNINNTNNSNNNK